MTFSTRKAALAAGSPTYFTGNPCKHGHISYRYTQSGGCRECINGAVIGKNDPENLISITESKLEYMRAKHAAAEMVEAARLKMMADTQIRKISPENADVIRYASARRTVKENLTLTKVRVFDAERSGIALVAYGLAVMRFPELQPADIDPQLPPVHREPAGTAMHSFYCHPDDVQALRQAAADTFARYPTDIQARRAQALQSALDLAEAAASPAPPMTFK